MTESSTVSVGLVITLFSPIIGLLLTGNIFFVKKLVDKIGEAVGAIPQIMKALSNLKLSVDEVSKRQAEHSDDIRNLKKLEGRIAYIEGLIAGSAPDADQAH